jgi:hypothetical protein
MRPSASLVLLLGVLAGCASMPQGSARTSEVNPPFEVIQVARLNSLLAEMHKVVAGTPTEQAEILAIARQGYEQSPGSPAALRYGLLLGAPVHPGRNPAQSQQLLRESLARRELLSPYEQALAEVELERVTTELLGASENQRLVEELRQERDRQRNGASTANLQRQLQAANDANVLLRRQLDEARAKLDAIAELERQAGRPPNSEGSSTR